MMSQVAELEFPFGYSWPEFYCPACGAPIMARYEDCEGCPHVICAGEDGERFYVAPREMIAMAHLLEHKALRVIWERTR